MSYERSVPSLEYVPNFAARAERAPLPRVDRWQRRAPATPRQRLVRVRTRGTVYATVMPAQAPGLGFSLKRPKWLKRITTPPAPVRKVIVAVAKVAPPILPLALVTGAVKGKDLGRIATGYGKMAAAGAAILLAPAAGAAAVKYGSAAIALAKRLGAVKYQTPPIRSEAPMSAEAEPVPVQETAPEPAQEIPTGYAVESTGSPMTANEVPGYSYAGGGGGGTTSAPAASAEAVPAPAGDGKNLLPLALAGGAVLLMMARKR